MYISVVTQRTIYLKRVLINGTAKSDKLFTLKPEADLEDVMEVCKEIKNLKRDVSSFYIVLEETRDIVESPEDMTSVRLLDVNGLRLYDVNGALLRGAIPEEVN